MARSFRVLILLMSLLVLSLTGCSKPGNGLEGTYTGRQQLSEKAKKLLGENAERQDMAMTLTLDKDKSASLTAPGQSTINGTWTNEKNQIIITLGPPGSPPMKLNLSPDKKTLTLDMSGAPRAAAYGSVVFTKN